MASPADALPLYMLLASPLQPTIIEERAVFLRERADGLYTPATYLASREGARQCGQRARTAELLLQAVHGHALSSLQFMLHAMLFPAPSPLQLYKLSEEFSVSLTMTVPYAIAVFYIVKLQARLLPWQQQRLEGGCYVGAELLHATSRHAMPCHAVPVTCPIPAGLPGPLLAGGCRHHGGRHRWAAATDRGMAGLFPCPERHDMHDTLCALKQPLSTFHLCPTVLALLVGALAPNQAVAGMALPMYTTSLLCEPGGWVIAWPCRALCLLTASRAAWLLLACCMKHVEQYSHRPFHRCRLLGLPDHLGQYPVRRLPSVSSELAVHMLCGRDSCMTGQACMQFYLLPALTHASCPSPPLPAPTGSGTRSLLICAMHGEPSWSTR